MTTERSGGADPAGHGPTTAPTTATSAVDAARPGTAGTTPAATGDPHARGAFSPRYLAFATATGLSSLGDAAWVIALTATLTRLSDAAVAGSVLALAGIPRVVAMLGGGAMADRRGARWVMIWTDVLRFALMGAAAIAIALWSPSIPLLVVLAALLAFLGSFFVPASGALRPKLLRKDELVRGNALYLIGLRSGQAAGGPVGAWVLGLGGAAAVALVNAVSYLVSALATVRCAPREVDEQRRPGATAARGADRASTLRRIGEGFALVRADRQLTVLLAVIALLELAGAGPLNVGLILVAQHLDSGAAGAGLLLTGYTVGATATFLLSLVLPAGRRAGVVAALCMVGYAGALVGVGQSRALVVTVLLYGALGAFSAQSSLVLTSTVQRRLPDHARGRVMSIMSLLIFGAVPVGNLTAGVMVQGLGVPTTMLVQGGLALVGLLVFVSDRTVRRTSLA